VARYHGRSAARDAAREFAHIFREKGLPEEIEEVALRFNPMASASITPSWTLLPNVLKESGMVASTSDARRLISQGAVKIDGEKATEVNLELTIGETYQLQVGKRRFKKVTLLGE